MNQTTNIDLDQVLAAVVDAGLFSKLCTIKAPTRVADALGQDNPTYANVAGMVNIPCMKAPEMPGRVRSQEMKTPGYTSEYTIFHVLLDGYYPTIRQRYQAVIDGEALEIQSVESDSQGIMTRMACRKYSL